jgi:hypothetical protein
MIDKTSFADVAHRTLGVGLESYGFKPAGEEAFRVRFEKPSASYVEVTYDASRSHEVSIWLGESPAGPEPPLELADALRATDCDMEDIEFAELIQTADADALGRLLERAAELLRRCANRFLEDEHDAFAAARALRSERAAEYTAQLQNRGILEAADTAWEKQDYGRVHDLLNPIRDSLDDAHRRRLGFAEKRL